jgi:hypothetical protein
LVGEVNGPAIEVSWHSPRSWFGLFPGPGAGWRIQLEESRHEFLFDRALLDAIPRNLRAAEVLVRFDEAVGQPASGGSFIDFWTQLAARREPTFALDFPDTWDIPWELLVGRLELPEVREKVAFVRRVSSREPASPSEFTEPLRTVIVLGDEDPPDGPRLRLRAEAEDVVRAWNGLDAAVRRVVEEPVWMWAEQDVLGRTLDELRPHLVVYSGHGRARPAGVQLADGSWVSPEEYAALLAPSPARRPVFASFWACSTGRAEAGEAEGARTLPNAPAFARALIGRGVIAVMAMQAPIRDRNARRMASTLFVQLAQGRPLERAVAAARALVLPTSARDGHPLDWASPVVWSASAAVPQIAWKVEATHVAVRQLAARRLLQQAAARLPVPATADPVPLDEPDAEERARAAAWADTPRTWVIGDPEDYATGQQWLRTLSALQADHSLWVIPVELAPGTDTEEALRLWAERAGRQMLPGDVPDDVGRMIRDFRTPQAAWRALCAAEGRFLAVSNPPEWREEDRWFWEALLQGAASRPFAILGALASGAPPLVTGAVRTLPEPDWQYEDFSMPVTDTAIQAALADAPRLALAMAILNLPLDGSHVRVPEHDGPANLEAWRGHASLLIVTPAGRVLHAAARRKILEWANDRPAELARAHYDAAMILADPRLQLTPELRERQIRHLLGVFQDPAPGFGADPYEVEASAARVADALFVLYRETERPRAVLALERLIAAQRSQVQGRLSHESRLVLAWAWLRLGHTQEAKFWLRRASPRTPPAQAWRHALQAELLKSTGEPDAKQGALEEIDRAISVCRADLEAGGEGAQVRLRAYEQDRARILQYLFYDAEGAARAYDSLVRNWRGVAGASLDIAVVRRNWAEALRTLADKQKDPSLLDSADVLLNEALKNADAYRASPVLAEVWYESARNEAARGRTKAERRALSSAIDAARHSGHDMLLAIAQNREFWRLRPFDPAEWEVRAAELAHFPGHGWAVRALVNGRICAAEAYLRAESPAAARGELEAAEQAMAANPSFDQGTDRWRRAAIAAGLEALSAGEAAGPSPWERFAATYAWVPGWLAEHTSGTADEVWQAWTGRKCRQPREG